MLKKLLSIIFAIFVSVGVLAGCNLVQINSSKYYTQTVAEVVFQNTTKTFTMKDLLTAYNNYGYQYMQNGSSAEEAVKSTVDTMIDRALLVDAIKAMPDMTLTNVELQQLKRDTYANINETLSQIETEVLKDWKLEVEDGEAEEEEKTSLRTKYTPYEPTVIIGEDGTLTRVIKPDTNVDESNAGEFVQNITNPKVSAEAWKRYTNTLKETAKAEGVKNKSVTELFNREIDRIYKVLEENKYIEKFQKAYTNSLNINSDMVVKRYVDLVTRDYYKYENNLKAYHAAMRSDAKGVYYHPTGAANAYLNVTHILVKLSAEQNEEIAELNKRLTAKEITQSDYDYYLNQIKQRTQVSYETEGGEVKQKSIFSVYNEVEQSVGAFSKNTASGRVNRAKAFNELIYKYNDDTGIMNSDFAYVVNLTEVEGQSDIMIEEFTKASRNLHTDSGKGAGSISDLVFAEFADGEYGFHIIMNLGVVENYVPYSIVNNTTWQKLYQKTTQPAIEKTLFHVLYDELASDETNTRTSQIVSEVKQTIKVINKYESRYKNLWK